MLPKADVLSASITGITDNGKKLLDDAKLLFDWDRYSTALALAVLAQEEFAKAFLLQLVRDEALPWLPEVQRSIARHQCKHLLAIVMEWLPPVDWDKAAERYRQLREKHEQRMAWLQRRIDRYKRGLLQPDPDDPEPREPDISFPIDVVDALNIYRHEEIERFRCGHPWKDEDWAAGKARKIADGLLDRKKQSALYVGISKSGQVGLHPGLVTREEASEAIGRAEQLAKGPEILSDEYMTLTQVLRLIFANLTDTSTSST
jgi:AbiV family abortive infection protein